jgi:hypothetical protein
MTLIVKNGEKLMPVIRKPNFSDVTDDVPIDTFKLKVGNEKKGAETKIVSLSEYLQNLHLYTDVAGKANLYYAEKDANILTSSQCCIIPVMNNTTDFAVQLFNYQSYDDDPAVLVILATKDGTSAQILKRSNQKLFFNDQGDAHWFSAERLQDVRERRTGKKQDKVKTFKEMSSDEKMENVIMMFQVPLKVKERPRSMMLNECSFSYGDLQPQCAVTRCSGTINSSRGMDMAVLGLGSHNGNFSGTEGKKLERDTRFPIRCTFQYYRVTDGSSIGEHDVNDIAQQLSQATQKAVATGSLVVDGLTTRTTEPDLAHPVSSDSPFGKLGDRDYLKQNPWVTPTELPYATVSYNNETKLASFM